MRRSLLLALAVIITASAVHGEDRAERKDHAPYVHVVIFRMKKDVPRDAVDKAIADCHTLLAKIPAVRSVRAGRPAAHGTPDVPKVSYDFALLVLLDDADGLKAYLEHPLHKKFVEQHGPAFDMEKLRVFDFENQTPAKVRR